MKSSQKSNNSEEETDSINTKPVFSYMEVYATFVAAFTFLCIGLLRAYTSPAISSMKRDPDIFNTTQIPPKEVISWVASSPPLASFIGTILSGPLLEYSGRQTTLVILTIPYILGWALIGFAQDVAMILSGRVLTGLAAGIATAGAQLYVSECVRAEVRGFLGFLPSMMLALGVLVGFSASTIDVEWRELGLIMGAIPVLLFVMTLTVPESPTWLILKYKETKARKNLQKLRGKESSPEDIEDELDTLKEAVSQERRRRKSKSGSIISSTIMSSIRGNNTSNWKVVLKREIWFPAIIAVCLMIFQQFAAANVVIYFCSVILTEAEPRVGQLMILTSSSNYNSSFPSFDDNDFGSNSSQASIDNAASALISVSSSLASSPFQVMDHNSSSVVVGLIQFLAFFMSLPLIDRLGRKVLLITSAILMALPLSTLGIYFHFNSYVIFPSNFTDTGGSTNSNSLTLTFGEQFIASTYSWLPVTCLCIFIAAYSIGFGPVPFIIMSEIFPSKARSYLCSLTSFVNHFALFVVIKTFPIFIEELGPNYTFWGYSASCFASILFVVVVVPETKGKTLVEIERHFTKEVVPLIDRRDSHSCGLP